MNQQPDPTPSELFALDPIKRDRLRALLADPVLVEAFDIVDDLMRPKVGGSTDANQALSIARFHQSAGCDEFIKKLRSMTREPKERVVPTIKKLAKSIEDLPKEQP